MLLHKYDKTDNRLVLVHIGILGGELVIPHWNHELGFLTEGE